MERTWDIMYGWEWPECPSSTAGIDMDDECGADYVWSEIYCGCVYDYEVV